MNNPIILFLLSWFFPGSGYFILGKVKRGLIVAGVIWIMFIIAILSGGAYYPGYTYEEGKLLYILNMFARLGNGFGAVISLILNQSPPADVAANLTFEYGGRFLEAVGLINILAVIDVFDIYSGRKE